MAVPVVAAIGAEKTGTGKAITLSAPSGVSAGDLLVAQIGNTASSAEILKVPSGWTLLKSVHDGFDALEVYWKIAAGGDSYAWEVDEGNWAGIALRITGHDPASAIPVSGTSSAVTAVSTLKSAVITTPRPECLVVSLFCEDSAASGIGWSSAGATEIYDFQDPVGFVEIAGYTETKEVAGEISRTASLATARECSSVIFAVQPPEAAASGNRARMVI